MSKHTPGPWIIKNNWIVSEAEKTGHDDKKNLEHYGGHLICESMNNEANARLIATAPELLEACKEARKIISIARKYFPKSIKNADTFTLTNVDANIIGEAIAKAEGQK